MQGLCVCISSNVEYELKATCHDTLPGSVASILYAPPTREYATPPTPFCCSVKYSAALQQKEAHDPILSRTIATNTSYIGTRAFSYNYQYNIH